MPQAPRGGRHHLHMQLPPLLALLTSLTSLTSVFSLPRVQAGNNCYDNGIQAGFEVAGVDGPAGVGMLQAERSKDIKVSALQLLNLGLRPQQVTGRRARQRRARQRRARQRRARQRGAATLPQPSTCRAQLSLDSSLSPSSLAGDGNRRGVLLRPRRPSRLLHPLRAFGAGSGLHRALEDCREPNTLEPPPRTAATNRRRAADFCRH